MTVSSPESGLIHRCRDAVPGHVRLTENEAEPSDNRMDEYVGRVRRKLGDNPKDPRHIQTVKRRGYRFLAPAD